MLKAISQASVKANVSAANIGRATPFNCVDLHAIGTKFFFFITSKCTGIPDLLSILFSLYNL